VVPRPAGVRLVDGQRVEPVPNGREPGSVDVGPSGHGVKIDYRNGRGGGGGWACRGPGGGGGGVWGGEDGNHCGWARAAITRRLRGPKPWFYHQHKRPLRRRPTLILSDNGNPARRRPPARPTRRGLGVGARDRRGGGGGGGGWGGGGGGMTAIPWSTQTGELSGARGRQRLERGTITSRLGAKRPRDAQPAGPHRLGAADAHPRSMTSGVKQRRSTARYFAGGPCTGCR